MKKKILGLILGVLIISMLSFGIYSIIDYIIDTKQENEQKQIIKEYYDNKLITYENENNLYDDYYIDIAFLGDSLTDGYDVKSYYSEYNVSNRGIGGETTIGLEKRLEVSVLDLKPKVTVMLIGGNNLDTMFDNYEDILISLKSNLKDTKIVLLSLTAMGRDWAYKNELACLNNVKIKLLAEKYDCSYIDLFTPLYDISTNELYEKYTTDGVHFNKLGYDYITSIIKPVIDELLMEE